jgi:WD40 repeat protein
MFAAFRLLCRLTIAAVFGCTISAHAAEARERFEAAAAQIPFFPYESHAVDRYPRYYASEKEAKAAWDCVRELLAPNISLPELDTLTRHQNSKVRTLALLGLIQTEDRAAVPLIHQLMNDPAPAFPDYAEMEGRPFGEKVSPRDITVGNVAKILLAPLGFRDYLAREHSAEEYFREWRRDNLDNPDWIGWYSFLYCRCTSDIFQAKPESNAKTQKLRETLADLRPALRAWCLLEWTYMRDSGVDPRIATEAEVIKTVKQLGSEALIDYLRDGTRAELKGQREPERHGQFFILPRTRSLFARRDAPALLKLGQYIAAAELAPENASKWLRRALSEWKEPYRAFERGRVMAALLELSGDKEAEFIAKWFAEVADQRGGENPLSTFFTDVRRRKPKQWEKTFRLIAATPEFNQLGIYDTGSMAAAINEFSGSEVIRLARRDDAWDAIRNGIRRAMGVRELAIESLTVPGEIARPPAWSVVLKKEVNASALSGNGKLLAVGYREGGASVLDADSGRVLADLPTEGDAILVHFKRGTDTLLTLSSSGLFTEWSPESWHAARISKLPVGSSDTAFSGDGQKIAKRGAGVFDTTTGLPLWQDKRRTISFGLIALSPDGERIAMCDGASKTIELFSAEDGRVLATLRGHVGVPTRACFSPDGRWLASMAQDDDRLILWDGRTGAPKREYAVSEHSRIAFTADSKHFFATPRGASTVATYECETGTTASGFDPARSWPHQLLAHPDGVRVFTIGIKTDISEEFEKPGRRQFQLQCWVLPDGAR